MRKIDAIDRKLLRLLQDDAQTPMTRLAEAVNLSPTPCWRHIQRLKDEGVITKQVTLLDPKKLNLGVTVFVGGCAPAIRPRPGSRRFTRRSKKFRRSWSFTG